MPLGGRWSVPIGAETSDLGLRAWQRNLRPWSGSFGSLGAATRRAMTLSGVGSIAPLTFKAAVYDPTRLRRSKTVAAHFVLTPHHDQSGERDNPGRTSKAGDAEVRSALFLAANTIMNGRGQSSPLRKFGARLSRLKGRRRVIVAVARKLSRACCTRGGPPAPCYSSRLTAREIRCCPPPSETDPTPS